MAGSINRCLPSSVYPSCPNGYTCATTASQCESKPSLPEVSTCQRSTNCTACTGAGCTWLSTAKTCYNMCPGGDSSNVYQCKQTAATCPADGSVVPVSTPTMPVPSKPAVVSCGASGDNCSSCVSTLGCVWLPTLKRCWLGCPYEGLACTSTLSRCDSAQQPTPMPSVAVGSCSQGASCGSCLSAAGCLWLAGSINRCLPSSVYPSCPNGYTCATTAPQCQVVASAPTVQPSSTVTVPIIAASTSSVG